MSIQQRPTTSILMPLSGVVAVLKFFALIRSRHFSQSYASSLLKPYRSKPFFMHSSHDFLSRPLSFPSYFKLDVLTDKMTITPQTALIYIFDHNNNTHPIPKDISRHPTDQSHRTHHPDHAMLLPTQPRLIRDSKFSSFTTLQQIFPLCFKDKPCFPTNTYLHFLNFFHALPVLALIGSDAPP